MAFECGSEGLLVGSGHSPSHHLVAGARTLSGLTQHSFQERQSSKHREESNEAQATRERERQRERERERERKQWGEIEREDAHSETLIEGKKHQQCDRGEITVEKQRQTKAKAGKARTLERFAVTGEPWCERLQCSSFGAGGRFELGLGLVGVYRNAGACRASGHNQLQCSFECLRTCGKVLYASRDSRGRWSQRKESHELQKSPPSHLLAGSLCEPKLGPQVVSSYLLHPFLGLHRARLISLSHTRTSHRHAEMTTLLL